MKNIKIKVWNKNKKLWADPNETIYINPDTGELEKKLAGLEIVLFTGLLDKNGKEIYEGDIVMKMGRFTTPKRNLYEIVFSEDGAFIGSSIKDYEVFGKGKRHLTLFPIADNYYEFPTEIIGNIYENPELLK